MNLNSNWLFCRSRNPSLQDETILSTSIQVPWSRVNGTVRKAISLIHVPFFARLIFELFSITRIMISVLSLQCFIWMLSPILPWCSYWMALVLLIEHNNWITNFHLAYQLRECWAWAWVPDDFLITLFEIVWLHIFKRFGELVVVLLFLFPIARMGNMLP